MSETGPSPEERLAQELADMLALHMPEDFPREETARRLLLLIVPALNGAKRSAHLQDAQTAHEEGMRMHRAAGEARRNGRVGVAYYRDSDSETAGRIADLILAKVPLPAKDPAIVASKASLLPPKGTR